jgi:hypothetical protein
MLKVELPPPACRSSFLRQGSSSALRRSIGVLFRASLFGRFLIASGERPPLVICPIMRGTHMTAT